MQRPVDIFIAYAGPDRADAEALHGALKALGRSPWMDHFDLTPGDPWYAAIGRALGSARAVVCLTSSAWTGRHYPHEEVARALEGARDGGLRVIPVYLDASPRGALPYGLTGLAGVDATARDWPRVAERVARAAAAPPFDGRRTDDGPPEPPAPPEPPGHVFVAREAQLAALERHLTPTDPAARPAPVLINGLPGVGRTRRPPPVDLFDADTLETIARLAIDCGLATTDRRSLLIPDSTLRGMLPERGIPTDQLRSDLTALAAVRDDEGYRLWLADWLTAAARVTAPRSKAARFERWAALARRIPAPARSPTTVGNPSGPASSSRPAEWAVVVVVAGVLVLAGSLLGLMLADESRAAGFRYFAALGSVLLILGLVLRSPSIVEQRPVFRVVIVAMLVIGAGTLLARGMYSILVSTPASDTSVAVEPRRGTLSKPTRSVGGAAEGSPVDDGPVGAAAGSNSGGDAPAGDDGPLAADRDEASSELSGTNPAPEVRTEPPDLPQFKRLEQTDARPAMLPIRPGRFMMGSPPDEEGRFEDEGQHEVIITRGFWLAETEVTEGQWAALMGRVGSSADPSYPVAEVNWYEAVAYTNALSDAEGLPRCYTLSGCGGRPGDGGFCQTTVFRGLDCRGYRLPSEAEWEYAARAGTTGARYGELDSIAVYGDARGGRAPVRGGRLPNAWGLYDMLGNASEWTQDEYAADITGRSEATPFDTPSPRHRVARGCGWYSGARYCRAALRGGDPPAFRSAYSGLRPARTWPLGP